MKMRVLVTAVLVMLVSGGSVLAIDYMGAPTGQQDAGQWKVGLTYSYSEFDVEAKSASPTAPLSNFKTQKLLVPIEYGISPEWDVYVLLGTSNAETNDAPGLGILGGDFKGSWEFSWGAGTRFTFYQAKALKLGVLGQVSWLNSKDTIGLAEWEIDAYEWQVAVGAEYDFGGFSLYGGPMLYFIDGKLESLPASYDLEPKDSFGGYIGAQVGIGSNLDANIEVTYVSDGYMVAGNLGWKF